LDIIEAMIKKILVLAAVSTVVLLFVRSLNNKDRLQESTQTLQEKVINVTPLKPIPKRTIDFEVKGQALSFSWAEATKISNIRLNSNLKNKETARELAKNNQCKNLVNGSFYDKSGEHIGLFIENGKTLSKYTVNRTFNGVFYISSDNMPYINTVSPQEEIRTALQSGPILLKDGVYRKFDIKNDDKERRTMLAIADTGVVFISIYEKNSVFRGPYLSDLPEVLKEIETKLDKKFISALNLDGGTASAFITDELTLGEISPIGSYFCF